MSPEGLLMFSPELLRELYQHMEWADAKVWRAVPRGSPADHRLLEWLVHIHVVQRAFLHVWTGRTVEEAFRNPDDFATVDDVSTWAQAYYPEAHAFIDAVTDEQLRQPVVMPWAAQLSESLGRPPGITTLGNTCFQVTSHTTHHRGQVNARLRELGAEPPLVDYIGWVWFGKPAPDWKATV
jgi:uncharacterized damage-inducible protein DinB